MAILGISNGEGGLSVRTKLNTNFLELSSNYLPLGGGVMTGQLLYKTIAGTKATPSLVASGLSLDLNTANIFFVTLNSSLTSISLTNTPTNPKVFSFILQFSYNSNTLYAVTWPSSFKWAGAAAPSLTCLTSKVDTFTFMTHDGGTTWYAYSVDQNQ